MGDKPIRVGIVGISPDPVRSWATRAHVPAIRHLPNFELKGVCGSSLAVAEATAKHFEVPLAFADPAKLAAHPDIDLVVIAVKAPMHRQMVEHVLPAGKDVFCEWPLGATAAEAKEILAATERAGVSTLVGLQSRCNETLNYVRDLIHEGFVGRVTAVTMHAQQMAFGPVETPDYAHMADIRSGANLLTVGGGHALSAMCHVVGDFRELSAVVASLYDVIRIEGTAETMAKTTPDQIAIQGILDSGAVASVHLKGGATRTLGTRLEINGSDGDILLESAGPANFQRAPFVLRGGRGDCLEELTVPERYRLQPPGLPPGDAVAVAHLYAQYARYKQAGGEPPPDFRYGVKWREFLDTVVQASATGERQYLQN